MLINDEKVICNICLEKTTKYIFCDNCKHLEWYICETCTIKMQTFESISKKCPLCRRESEYLIELYNIIDDKHDLENDLEYSIEHELEHVGNTGNTEFIDLNKYYRNVRLLYSLSFVFSFLIYLISKYICSVNISDTCYLCDIFSIVNGVLCFLFVMINMNKINNSVKYILFLIFVCNVIVLPLNKECNKPF